MPKINLKQQAAAELLYWRGRLGFPDLTPQATIAASKHLPARPEVDPVAKKQFDVLVEALLARAANVAHLDRIVTALRNKHKECPTPPEIHAAADAVDAAAESDRATEWTGEVGKCPHGECDGGGFVVRPGKGATFCRCHAAYVAPKGGAAHDAASR